MLTNNPEAPMTEEKPNVKTTLTKDDAAGWYLAENDSGTGEFSCVYWDGEKTYLSHDPNHKGYRWSVGWTNFRRLVEAPEPAGLDGISSKTFRIEHNPNCVKPFLVRFPGKGKGMIHGDQRDAIGCGMTIIEAINAAEDPYRKITPEPVTNEAAREEFRDWIDTEHGHAISESRGISIAAKAAEIFGRVPEHKDEIAGLKQVIELQRANAEKRKQQIARQAEELNNWRTWAIGELSDEANALEEDDNAELRRKLSFVLSELANITRQSDEIEELKAERDQLHKTRESLEGEIAGLRQERDARGAILDSLQNAVGATWWHGITDWANRTFLACQKADSTADYQSDLTAALVPGYIGQLAKERDHANRMYQTAADLATHWQQKHDAIASPPEPEVIEGRGQAATKEQEGWYLVQDETGRVNHIRQLSWHVFAEGYRYMRCPTFPPRKPAFVPPEKPEQFLVRAADGQKGEPFYVSKMSNGLLRSVECGNSWHPANVELLDPTTGEPINEGKEG